LEGKEGALTKFVIDQEFSLATRCPL